MTNEQLLMLDSLVYFSKFSNNFTPKSDGTFYSVGDFVNAALANPNDYETCFNGALGYNDGDLGMYDILGLVKDDPALMSLKIVYPQTADDHTTNSVCLINSGTNDVYVIFGGNYTQGDYQYGSTDLNTWVENAMGATESNTDEQLRSLDFYEDSIIAAFVNKKLSHSANKKVSQF